MSVASSQNFKDDELFPVRWYVDEYNVPEKRLRLAIKREEIDYLNFGPRSTMIPFGGFKRWLKIFLRRALV